MSTSFKPGDAVIWLKRVPGGGDYVFPFMAKVLAVTAKRVKIEVNDPDENGSGFVIRHVPPESLQHHQPTKVEPDPERSSVTKRATKRGRSG